MTPEDLENLILDSKTSAAVQEAFAGLDAAQRKKLSTAARKLFAQISSNKSNKDASDRLKKFIGKGQGGAWRYRGSQELRNAILALYAFCPISAVKKRDYFLDRNDRDVVRQIVLDRRPDWLDEWVEYELEQDFPRIDFSMLRHWIKSGACKKPNNDGYYQVFAAHMLAPAPEGEPPRPPLSKQLLDEPDLLEDVWALFRVESVAFDSGAGFTHTPDDYEDWLDALVKLSEGGHLDRQRLLDASLEGLSQDLKQNHLSGLHKFHRAVAPNEAEREARQDAYLALLSHKVGHVCKFALELLGQIEKDGRLDAGRFLSEVPAIFLQEGKGNALAALKLVQRIHKNSPALSEDALRAAAEALRSSNMDVQERAIEILDRHKQSLGPELGEEIHLYLGFVPASLKGKLSSLLAAETTHEEAVTSQDMPAREDLEGLIAGLPPHKARALRINEILGDANHQYLPISDNILDHAILPAVEPLAPVETVDELISLASHAVEIVETPDVIEQIIDGISRLCHDRSGDFEAKTAPLLHRIEQGGSESCKGIVGYDGVQSALTDLLRSWLSSALHDTRTDEYSERSNCFEPAILHLQTIARRAAGKKSAPLLSAPSHTGGWIDPLVWVGRLRAAEANNHHYDDIDFCLSVLRLTPDNRAPALEEAKALSGPQKRPAVFALGGDAELTLTDRPNCDLWISAARSRDPHADWSDFFLPLKIIDTWPDSVQPARVHWRAFVEETGSYGGEVYKIPRLDIKVGTETSPAPDGETKGMKGKIGEAISSQFKTDWKRLPSAALSRQKRQTRYWAGGLSTAWATQWLAYQWPLCPHGAHLAGARSLAIRIDDDSCNWTPGFGYLNALFQKNRPWREAGHWVLCLGLTGKDADCRGLAIDAAIEGIDAGQFDPEIFASILAELSNGGWLRLNRLGDNLMQVIQASSVHAWVVGEALQLWLAETDIKQRNLFRILEVLLEAQSQTGATLHDKVRSVLAGVKGSSKAAKLAAKLVKLGNDGAPASNAIKSLAVSSRLRAA